MVIVEATARTQGAAEKTPKSPLRSLRSGCQIREPPSKPPLGFIIRCPASTARDRSWPLLEAASSIME
ncbi:unnamed protein product [Staurois parvus]|uniref:Uncharacterized protein n=1 Tax=Staurois parvus TaxID=386267 RepID=A0ABN9DM85_9NEOB|nr:unnamed protein product [Staurois parvus]